MIDRIKPWTAISALGLLAFLASSFVYFGSPNAGAGISLVMAIITYVSAPAAWDIFYSNNIRMYPAAVLAAYLSIASSTLAYNMLMYDMPDIHRGFNTFLALYILLGILFVRPKSIK